MAKNTEALTQVTLKDVGTIILFVCKGSWLVSIIGNNK